MDAVSGIKVRLESAHRSALSGTNLIGHYRRWRSSTRGGDGRVEARWKAKTILCAGSSRVEPTEVNANRFALLQADPLSLDEVWRSPRTLSAPGT